MFWYIIFTIYIAILQVVYGLELTKIDSSTIKTEEVIAGNIFFISNFFKYINVIWKYNKIK